MSAKKLKKVKDRLHSRNRNRERYDLDALKSVVPELSEFIKLNKYGNESVDFANPIAVKLLNRALLQHYYGINYWEFPDENLCPPIPGRADYLHYAADLLSESNYGVIPKGDMIKCLDVGVGASCIYPILGVVEYGWDFIGSDISAKSIESAENIVNKNDQLTGKVDLLLQKMPESIFKGIMDRADKIDVTICNPPFHATSEDAHNASMRKSSNLKGEKVTKPVLNFSGSFNELVTKGGEPGFIQTMAFESQKFANSVLWFTTLVSKQSNLKGLYKTLQIVNAEQVKTISVGTGNKSGRIVAWTFLSSKARNNWRNSRWTN